MLILKLKYPKLVSLGNLINSVLQHEFLPSSSVLRVLCCHTDMLERLGACLVPSLCRQEEEGKRLHDILSGEKFYCWKLAVIVL